MRRRFVYFVQCFFALLLLITLGACSTNDNTNNNDEEVTIIDNTVTVIASSTIRLTQIGRFTTGIFAEGAAEIVAYDVASRRLFVVNGNQTAPTVDVLNLSDPTAPTQVGTLDIQAQGAAATSVAVNGGVVAVAIVNANRQENGVVAFYNASTLALLNTVAVGPLPDMVVFTPNGQRLLVANEGEPNDAYTVDPEGSISIIDITNGVSSASVTTATFTSFNAQKAALIAAGVRIFGPESTADEPDNLATVAQDLEPEFIAVSPNSQTAWVTLQENNAIAVVNIETATVTAIWPLGFKNHAIPGNELDASDRDGGINIRTWPVFGMYQPDAIAAYTFDGNTYLVTANEGDSRDVAGFSEVAQVANLALDPAVFPDALSLQLPENLGRLLVTTTLGDNNGAFARLFAFGARSFSIWDTQGRQVYDSGNTFEVLTANRLGEPFNSNNDDNDSGDSRSEARGPEPEGVTLATLEGRTYAFLGLERVGGIVVYDVSNPESPRFVQYLNNRDFSVAATAAQAGDLGPEGLLFIPSADSPGGQPLLVVANEVSGSTTIYRIDVISLRE